MSIHYKFKSALEYDTVTFDGLHISVRDLKKSILHQKRIGKNIDFDLQVTNAQTKEVYTDDNALIPKNTSLIIARIPLTVQQKKAWDRNESNLLRDNSAKGGEGDGQDATLHRHAKTLDLSSLDASEEDKILAMMSQSTQDYNPSNYMKIRGANQVGDVPANYRCYKCHQPGHWIKNCPSGANVEPIEIKKSTGIPRSFMVPVEGPQVTGAMMTPSGTFAVPAVDHQAYKEGKKERPPFQQVPQQEVVKPEIPEDLVCSICKDLLTDAVMIPCCGNSFCDECVRTVLIESEEHVCPDCKEKDVSPDTLIPNRFLRTAVNNFRNATGYNNSRYHPPTARVHPPPLQQLQQKKVVAPPPAPEPMEEVVIQSGQPPPPGQPIETVRESSHIIPVDGRPIVTLERRHRDLHLRDGMDGHNSGQVLMPPGVDVLRSPQLVRPYQGPPVVMQPLPPHIPLHIHQGYPLQVPGPFGPRMPMYEQLVPFRPDHSSVMAGLYPDMDPSRGGYRGNYRGRGGRGYPNAPYRNHHPHTSSSRTSAYIASKLCGIDDPMAIFERMLREKDARDRRRRARRSRSRSFSRSRSRSYSPRSRSRSPPPMRKRERTHSRSFTISSRYPPPRRISRDGYDYPGDQNYEPRDRARGRSSGRDRYNDRLVDRKDKDYYNNKPVTAIARFPPETAPRYSPREAPYDRYDANPPRPYEEPTSSAQRPYDDYRRFEACDVAPPGTGPDLPIPSITTRYDRGIGGGGGFERGYENLTPPGEERSRSAWEVDTGMPLPKRDYYDVKPSYTSPEPKKRKISSKSPVRRSRERERDREKERDKERFEEEDRHRKEEKRVKPAVKENLKEVAEETKTKEKDKESSIDKEKEKKKEEKKVKDKKKRKKEKEAEEKRKRKRKERKEGKKDVVEKKKEKYVKETDVEETEKPIADDLIPKEDAKDAVANKVLQEPITLVEAPPTESLYDEIDDARIDNGVMATYGKTLDENIPSAMLAPVPELSKWELEEDFMSPGDKTNVDASFTDAASKVVTSEVLKRAENAIFQKAINAIRPLEGSKKVPEGRKEEGERKEGGVERKERKMYEESERKEKKIQEEFERKEKMLERKEKEFERKEWRIYEDLEKKERKVHEDSERKDRKTHDSRSSFEGSDKKDRKVHEEPEPKDRKSLDDSEYKDKKSYDSSERKDRKSYEDSERKDRKPYDDSERKDSRKAVCSESDLAVKSMEADHREARKIANTIQITIPVEIPSLINMPLITPASLIKSKPPLKLDRSKFSSANWTKANDSTPSPRRVSAKDRLGARVDDLRANAPKPGSIETRSRSRTPHRKVSYDQQQMLRKHEDKRYERMMDRFEEEQQRRQEVIKRHEDMERHRHEEFKRLEMKRLEDAERYRYGRHYSSSRREWERRRSRSVSRERREEKRKMHKSQGKFVRNKSTSDRDSKKDKKKDKKHKKEKKKGKEDDEDKEELNKAAEEKELAINPTSNGDDTTAAKVVVEEVVKKAPRKAPKKPTLDEANFEPDYDLSEAESGSEKITPVKKELSPVVLPAAKEAAKKRAHSESESSDEESSEESSSSDNSSDSTKRRKHKRRKHKHKKTRNNSSSDSQSESDSGDSSSESGGRKKKMKKHKRTKTKLPSLIHVPI